MTKVNISLNYGSSEHVKCYVLVPKNRMIFL